MSRRARSRATLLGVLVCVGLAACSDGGTGGVTGQTGFVQGDPTVTMVAPDDREPAPDLAGTLVGGGSFSLADVREDDIVVVNVWGSWCAPCRAEAETLEAVYRDLRDDGVRFLGLNTRDTEAAALGFLRTFDVTYPNLDDTDAHLQLGFRNSLPSASIPTTWVIDRQGRVAARALGGTTEERLRAMLEPVLAEGMSENSAGAGAGAAAGTGAESGPESGPRDGPGNGAEVGPDDGRASR